jgi:RecJ-like exonuclease
MTANSGSDGDDRVVYELQPECTVEELDEHARYLATVNGVVEYGVFVDVSEHVSGLVHESTLSNDYAIGDRLVVTLDRIRENGDLAFSPADLDPEEATVETVEHQYEVTRAESLASLLARGPGNHKHGNQGANNSRCFPFIIHENTSENLRPLSNAKCLADIDL